jgi:hypothetical protein
MAFRFYLGGELAPRLVLKIENEAGAVLGVPDTHAVADGNLDTGGTRRSGGGKVA